MLMLQACGSSAWRVVIVNRAAAPIDGSASPRKPSVRIDNRSSSCNFDVACRSTASARSARGMPSPSSLTRISRRPPPSVSTSTRRAPASSAFSTSSFTTLAGRSTTSPAAMRLTMASDSWRTGIVRAPDRIAQTLPAHSGIRETPGWNCPRYPKAPGRRSVPGRPGATQALDAGAMLLGLEPLLALGFRHFRRPARRRPHRRLPDQVEKALARIVAIALLHPVLLRNNDNHALFGDALAGKPHQADRDVIGKRRRVPCIEAKLHG